MEKHGVVRGQWFRGTGLLTAGLLAALFIVCPRPLCGQEAQEEPGDIAVTLESFPEHPVLDGSWRVSILVDHPVPDEVTVIPPELPPSLSFAQSRKETRFVRSSAEQGRRWTLVEFLFVPHRTGTIVLEPFEALVRGSSFRTPSARTTVTTREGAPQEYRPRLVWDAPPPVLRVGETADLTLRVLDNDPQKPLRRLPLHLTAPAEALQEELPLSAEDLEQGLALRLRITALEGSRISLGPFSLGFETLSLEAPAISIALAPPRPGVAARPATVQAAQVQTAAGTPSPEPVDTALDGPAQSAPTPPAFPELREKPFPLFRGSYRNVLDKARNSWQRTLYAEALGELRRGERDLLSGPSLASTRREAERLLGLPLTEDEKWRPRNLGAALVILSFCLLLLAVALPLRTRGRGSEKKGVTSLFFHGYNIVVCVLIGCAGFGLVVLARSPGVFEKPVQGSAGENAPGKRPGNSALALRSCVAYRVPDKQGAVSARWMEGQPVKVRSASASWAYAESSGGDAGWVSQDDLLFY
jgi:hypothetical protein